MIQIKKSKVVVLFLAVVIGILSGAIITELLGLILPVGVVKTFFLKEVGFGIDPIRIDLALFEVTLGLRLHFNFISLVAVALTIYYFKWWL